MDESTSAEALRNAALRRDLLDAFRILDVEGQNSGIAGHVTCRIPGSEALLGHGYGLAFDEVDERTIHQADFELNCTDGGRVSPSLAFHVEIYRAQSGLGAVVHTHGRHAIALSAAGARFRPVYQSALMLWERVASYDRYDGIVESPEVGQRMAAALGDGRVLALRNHGIVAVGATVREAVCAAVIYEENCAIQLMAMAAGSVVDLGGDSAAEARDFLASPRVIDMRWGQLARKAARAYSATGSS